MNCTKNYTLQVSIPKRDLRELGPIFSIPLQTSPSTRVSIPKRDLRELGPSKEENSYPGLIEFQSLKGI